jgi:hypothetical protein
VWQARLRFQIALQLALGLVRSEIAAGNVGATMFPFMMDNRNLWLLRGLSQSEINLICAPSPGFNTAGCTGDQWTAVSIDRPYQAIAATLVHENAHANGIDNENHHWIAGLAAHLFIEGLGRANALLARVAGSGRIIPPIFRLP